jgi:hypothetical protein
MTAFSLSKSRLMSARRCLKQLWLDVHDPSLAVITPSAHAAKRIGRRVGEAARMVYTRQLNGRARHVPDTVAQEALAETAALLRLEPAAAIFEAAFLYRDVTVRVDVLLPEGDEWHLVEVKASTEVKEEHSFDCAIQSWVLRGAGVRLRSTRLAHIDSDFVYAGEGDYSGLLSESDLTTAGARLQLEVEREVASARAVLSGPEPEVAVGKHCFRPQRCPYVGYCWRADSDFPLLDLGGNKGKLGELFAAGYRDLRDVPPEDLSPRQRRIRSVTRAGRASLSPDAAAEIGAIGYPRYYLDFETVAPAVPLWVGTRPYEALPFQWSCHYEARPGDEQHADFLDLSGQAPMPRVAASLVRMVGKEGAVLTYTAYERDVIRCLARHVPELAPALAAIIRRLVDLKPITERHYYHPAMRGSWSLKAVLPTIAEDVGYDELEGIQHGMDASEAYFEATDPVTKPARKRELEQQLRRYCRIDTEAMVRLAHFLERGT